MALLHMGAMTALSLFTAQANAPLDYFLHAYGPAARPTMLLGWVFTAITVLVCIIIAVLLIVAIIRKRRPYGANQIGLEHVGLNWIYIGTGISTAVLFAMAVYALVVLNGSAAPSSAPALTIKVTAYDWWWQAQYDEFETANEIHIPVGVPVMIELKSADVIHAFWVPQLAGKTQTIPGVTNRQWLQADKPGIYRGQCTQFCGLQHAHMGFEIVAQSPDDFAEWVRTQSQPAAPASGLGQDIFMHECSACHTVSGTSATGQHAPNLTHLMSRRFIAAGTLSNTPQNVIDWVQHAQKIKPGNAMPDFTLSPQDASALSDYLSTLK